jgi:hypothetical protein
MDKTNKRRPKEIAAETSTNRFFMPSTLAIIFQTFKEVRYFFCEKNDPIFSQILPFGSGFARIKHSQGSDPYRTKHQVMPLRTMHGLRMK